MDKILKIDTSLVSKVAYRPLKRMTILFVIVLVYFGFIQTQTSHGQNGNDSFIYIPIVGSALLLSFILLYSFRLRKLIYANIEVIINDEGIRKSINYDTAGKLNIIDKSFISMANRRSPLYNISLTWQQVTAIDEKTHDLYIKSINASNFYGSGQIIIPKEIENYDEIKKIVVAHLNTNGQLTVAYST